MKKWTKKEIKDFGYRIVDIVSDYYCSLEDESVICNSSVKELEKKIENYKIEQKGLDKIKILSFITDFLIPNSTRIGSPNYFGQMNPTPTMISIFADTIASALNQSLALWQNSPAATIVEKKVIEFFCEKAGYSKDSFGTITSGGSQANLTGLLLARNKAYKTFKGLQDNLNNRFTFYSSELAHFSLERAIYIMGIKKDNFRKIPVNNAFRIDLTKLKNQIDIDLKNGFIPVCIIGTAGSVHVGSIDHLEELADLARKYEMWFHVDAAYGGALLLSNKFKYRIKGICNADSITLDPHKWLFVPFSCGTILVNNKECLEEIFNDVPVYLNNKHNGNNTIDLVNYNISCSRRFDALKIWLSLLEQGLDEYEKTINKQIELTNYLYRQIINTNEYKPLHKPETSILCFSHVNDLKFLKRSNNNRKIKNKKKSMHNGIKDLNKTIQHKIEKSGISYLALVRLCGVECLRINIMSFLTREFNIEKLMVLKSREKKFSINYKLIKS